MALLRKELATGVDYSSNDWSPCVACINGKQTKKPFGHKTRQRVNNFYTLTYADYAFLVTNRNPESVEVSTSKLYKYLFAKFMSLFIT